MPNRISRTAIHLATALVGLVAFVHLPVLAGDTWYLDVYLTEVHPHHVLVGEALGRGELPAWTSKLMMGYPLAYNPQVGAFYPFHAVLLPFVDAHVLLSWSVFLHGCLAAFGVFALARLAGATDPGAFAAAGIYAVSPFLVFYHQAIHGYVVLAWMPWAILFTWRAARDRNHRWLAAAALVVALQMYAGHLQFVLYTLLLMGLVALFGVPGRPWVARVRQAALTVGASLVSLALYAPQLLAAFVLWKHSLRRQLSSEDIAAAMHIEALGLDDLVELIAPRFFGGPSYRDFWYPEYVGIGALLAIGVALWTRKGPRLLAWTCLGAVVYLILVQLPGVGRLMTSIPGLSAFRAPGRIICWLLLFGAVLAGLGLDPLVETLRSRVGYLLIGLTACLGVALGLGAFDTVAPRDPELASTLVAGLRREDGWELVIIAIALAAVGAAAGRSPTLARWGLVACLLGPIVSVASRYSPTVQQVEDPPFLALLNGARPHRVLGIATGDPNYQASVPGPEGWPYTSNGDPVRAGWNLQANVGAAYGFANLHGQTSLPLRRVVTRAFGTLDALGYPFVEHPEYHPDLLAHLGVTHIVSRPTGQMPVQPRPPAIGERDGYSVLQIPRPRRAARFYPDYAIAPAADEEVALTHTRRRPEADGTPIEWPLVVEGYTPAGPSNPAVGRPLPVQILESGDGFARLELNAPNAGIVLYTQAWFPDWTATVDGEPVDIVVADGCFIGIPVSAGPHRIDLRFDPSPVRHGLPFMGLGAIGLVALGWRRRR